MALNKRWTVWSAVLGLAFAGVVGCAGSEGDGQPAGASAAEDTVAGDPVLVSKPGRPTAQVNVRIAALTDAQILGVLRTANLGEIQEAKQATTKEVAAEVGDFAKRMITEHTAANAQLSELAEDLRVRPAPSEITRRLQETIETTLQLLQKQNGKQFDRLYIDAQVAQHGTVLFIIDAQLMPSVRSPVLAEELQKFRATVKEHLDDSVKIQSAQGPAELNVRNTGG